MDELGNLPPAALVPFGIVLALIFGIRYLGLWQGQSAPASKSQAGATVAAVIVDPTALNRLSDEAAKLSDALDRLNETGERMARSEEHMAAELDRLREELYIQRELGRRGK